MKLKTKTLIGLCLIGLADVVVPLPVTAVILIYVVALRPPWFRELTNNLYDQ